MERIIAIIAVRCYLPADNTNNTADNVYNTLNDTEYLDSLINECEKLSNINLMGLMAIGPITNDSSEIKKYFNEMKKLKDKYKFEILSMGMSSDYKEALECGTDIVRIGSKIFGARVYKK